MLNLFKNLQSCIRQSCCVWLSVWCLMACSSLTVWITSRFDNLLAKNGLETKTGSKHQNKNNFFWPSRFFLNFGSVWLFLINFFFEINFFWLSQFLDFCQWLYMYIMQAIFMLIFWFCSWYGVTLMIWALFASWAGYSLLHLLPCLNLLPTLWLDLPEAL